MSDRETRKAARQCDDDTSRKGFTRRKPREISGRMETATSGKAFMRASCLPPESYSEEFFRTRSRGATEVVGAVGILAHTANEIHVS